MTYRPLSRRSRVVERELGMETLIYDLSSNKAVCLNETCALVYQLADGKRTAAEISDLMSIKLKDLVGEEMVYLALNELKKNDLLQNGAELNNYFAGMTRREVIRKVGLASLVALPIVSSLIAPASAAAASTCVPFTNACNPAANVCCPGSLCRPAPGGTACICNCVSPGDCGVQTLCPSTVNCNASKICAP